MSVFITLIVSHFFTQFFFSNKQCCCVSQTSRINRVLYPLKSLEMAKECWQFKVQAYISSTSDKFQSCRFQIQHNVIVFPVLTSIPNLPVWWALKPPNCWILAHLYWRLAPLIHRLVTVFRTCQIRLQDRQQIVGFIFGPAKLAADLPREIKSKTVCSGTR